MLTPELESVIGAEEPEYLFEAIAMNAAADDSLRLLSLDESAAPCRVVIAADAPAAELSIPLQAAAPSEHTPSEHGDEDEELLPTARSLRVPLDWGAAEFIHADGEEALADITLARGGDDGMPSSASPKKTSCGTTLPNAASWAREPDRRYFAHSGKLTDAKQGHVHA